VAGIAAPRPDARVRWPPCFPGQRGYALLSVPDDWRGETGQAARSRAPSSAHPYPAADNDRVIPPDPDARSTGLDAVAAVVARRLPGLQLRRCWVCPAPCWRG